MKGVYIFVGAMLLIAGAFFLHLWQVGKAVAVVRGDPWPLLVAAIILFAAGGVLLADAWNQSERSDD